MDKFILLLTFTMRDEFDRPEQAWVEYEDGNVAIPAYFRAAASFVVKEAKLIQGGKVKFHFGAF